MFKNIDYTEDKTLIADIFSLKAEILLVQNSEEALDWYLLAILYNPDESYNYEKVSCLLATGYSNRIRALLTDTVPLIKASEL